LKKIGLPRNFEVNKTDPRSRINFYTRLKIEIAGKLYEVCHTACQPTAVKQLANCRPTVIKLVLFLQGCRARLTGKADGQGYRARLTGKADGQGYRTRLPGKAAGQGCRARLPGKAAGQGCRARLPSNAAGQGF
jgi:hypothetical protein